MIPLPIHSDAMARAAQYMAIEAVVGGVGAAAFKPVREDAARVNVNVARLNL